MISQGSAVHTHVSSILCLSAQGWYFAHCTLSIIVCELNLTQCGKEVYLNFHYNLKLAFHFPEGEKDYK